MDDTPTPSYEVVRESQPMLVTLFDDVSAHRLTTHSWPWADFVERVAKPRKVYPNKAAMPLVKLARFGDIRTDKGPLRHDANVQAITGIERDYDAAKLSLVDAATMLADAPLDAMLSTPPN